MHLFENFCQIQVVYVWRWWFIEDFTQSFLSIRLIATGIYEDTDCCQRWPTQASLALNGCCFLHHGIAVAVNIDKSLGHESVR